MHVDNLYVSVYACFQAFQIVNYFYAFLLKEDKLGCDRWTFG